MQKIIFLDIDGPMIPLSSYIFTRNPSFDQILDDRCVDVLHAVIAASGAKIVFNTTHNRMLDPTDTWPGLRGVFHYRGFTPEYFAAVDHTLYPDVDRLTAIKKWQAENGEANWVAFDDAPIDDERAYPTLFEYGIGMGEYNHAAEYFGFKPKMVLY